MRRLLFSVYRHAVRLSVGYGLNKVGMIRAAHIWALKRLHPQSVRVFDKTLYLDPADSLNLSIHGVFEPRETELAMRLVKKGGVVVDVGANIGYYTLLFAKCVGENGRVYAFEPHPANAALLRRTIAESGYRNVIVEEKAVSKSSGRIRLNESQEGSVDHRILEGGVDGKALDIESVNLDDYFGAAARVDFIKMDIQGAEGWALQGMERLVARTKNLTLLTEFEPWGLERSGTGARAYLERLAQLGFTVYDINGPGCAETPADFDALCERTSNAKDASSNLLCVK